jgi:hypothetical protein
MVTRRVGQAIWTEPAAGEHASNFAPGAGREASGRLGMAGTATRTAPTTMVLVALGVSPELSGLAGIADVRHLITDPRSAALDELGTEPALRPLSARVAEQTGLQIELEVNLDYERFPWRQPTSGSTRNRRHDDEPAQPR